jgi:murein tripeptide amidase MpaA
MEIHPKNYVESDDVLIRELRRFPHKFERAILNHKSKHNNLTVPKHVLLNIYERIWEGRENLTTTEKKLQVSHKKALIEHEMVAKEL